MTVSAVSSRGRALIREAVADLRGQRLKALALLAVLACVAALALVVERDAATARADLDALLASPSSTVIRLETQDGGQTIPASIAGAAASVTGAAAAFVLGEPVIAEPHGIPADGRTVVMREVIGDPGWPTAPSCGAAWISGATAHRLGLADGVGALTVPGEGRPTVAAISTASTGSIPRFLADYALLRSCETNPAAELVVLAHSPDQVANVVASTEKLFPVEDRAGLRIQSQAGRIADARTASQAAQSSATRLAATAAIAASLLATLVLTGLVLQRRREFGRRRALGATRTDIVILIVIESLVGTTLAALIAAAAVKTSQALTDRPASPLQYLVGVTLMLICAGTLGGLIPGLIASRQDPAKEIRVP